MPDAQDNQKVENREARGPAVWFANAVAVVGGLVFLAVIWNVFFNFAQRGDVLEKHFSAIVGVPVAAALAFFLVVYLRQTEGPIEFSGLSFEFKGPSGQLAMWVVCFAAIAGAVKLLW
jgi:hypothetical protein